MDYKALAEAVLKIAQQASEAIMEIYNRSGDIVYDKKSNNSPLTQADQKGNQIICDALEKLDVQFPIISEENKLTHYDDRKGYEYFWLVDPLDGTKEFIKRNGEFTVNIALVKGQTPVLGVVVAPVLNQAYWAAEGIGSYLVENGVTTQLHAPKFSLSDKGLNVVCSRSHLNEDTQKFIDALDSPNLVSSGSSLKFLLLASGKAHLYPRIAPTMEWDTGAAHIILKEAGGEVIQYGKETPLVYNKENLLNPYFIAYANLQA